MWKPTQTQVPGIRTWTSLGDHYSARSHLIFFSLFFFYLATASAAAAALLTPGSAGRHSRASRDLRDPSLLIFFSYLSAHFPISYPAPARLWLGLANYSPRVESAHRLFVNNVLSEHGHAHPYILMWLSAFTAQQQSWTVVADPVWPAKPSKICCPASEYTGGEHLLTGPCKHRSVSELPVPSLQPVPKPTSPASL